MVWGIPSLTKKINKGVEPWKTWSPKGKNIQKKS